MTTLPEKNLLDGSKLPKTTTGEMKNALGKIRDYLAELLGDDSGDPEAARQKLGIDLAGLEKALSGKADRETVEALRESVDNKGVPVGTVAWFAMASPPAGYLKADGTAVERQTFPELFAAIGTTFGEGDGETTFNLPDLIGRFAEGSVRPGSVKDAGLPNITGNVCKYGLTYGTAGTENGALYVSDTGVGNGVANINPDNGCATINLDASRSSGIYGASDTVQPPALTLLPCIRAFEAIANTGSADVTALVREVAGKLDRTGGTMDGPVYFGDEGTGIGCDGAGRIVLSSRGKEGEAPATFALDNEGSLFVNGRFPNHVTEVYGGSQSWYRLWKDEALEQGGAFSVPGAGWQKFSFPRPFLRRVYTVLLVGSREGVPSLVGGSSVTTFDYFAPVDCYIHWYAYGY